MSKQQDEPQAGRRRVVRTVKITGIKPSAWKPRDEPWEDLDEDALSLARQGIILIGGWRQSMQETKKKVDDLQPKVVEIMQKAGIKTIDVEGKTFTHSATLVESTTLVLDEAALHKELQESGYWMQVSRRVLDQNLLADAIARGKVDAGIVAKHSSEKPRTPFMKITTKKKA